MSQPSLHVNYISVQIISQFAAQVESERNNCESMLHLSFDTFRHRHALWKADACLVAAIALSRSAPAKVVVPDNLRPTHAPSQNIAPSITLEEGTLSACCPADSTKYFTSLSCTLNFSSYTNIILSLYRSIKLLQHCSCAFHYDKNIQHLLQSIKFDRLFVVDTNLSPLSIFKYTS